eukprot:TRINITY_DN77481_c0_g1_i1.p1 TRINITY_DN77481_c0_g1~~TRINITY_DN77481_c0_g1_i1.p1  ORF type:complete len:393 (+),score=25.99 TRINITY_DN77481_c0_g1_i1:66-1244(+)
MGSSNLLCMITLLVTLCTHQVIFAVEPFYEQMRECGDVTITYCLNGVWDNPNKLAWDSGNPELGPSCRSFNVDSTKTAKPITCIKQPATGVGNPCNAIAEDDGSDIVVTNTFTLVTNYTGQIFGEKPLKTIVCRYSKQDKLSTQLQTYRARDVTLAGSGKFDVDLRPCGRLDDRFKLCNDDDMYQPGAVTVPRKGNLYFRSCIEGATNSDFHLVIRRCTSYDAPPPANKQSTLFVSDYCGVKNFTDTVKEITHISKVFVDSTKKCTIVQVPSHRYVDTDNLSIVCSINVCTEAKCANLKALNTDENPNTCRVNWSAAPPPTDRRMLAETSAESTEVDILSSAKAQLDALVVGATSGKTDGTEKLVTTEKSFSFSNSASSIAFVVLGCLLWLL